MTIPAYERAVWVDGKLANGGGTLPLWSGKGEPPEVGTVVETFDPMRHKCTITGYAVENCGDHSWLMALAHRHHDNRRGNLTGAEIHYADGDQAEEA